MEKFMKDRSTDTPILATDYRLGGIPATIIVSRDGMVVNRWQGAYTEQRKTEMEKDLRIALPWVPVELKNGPRPVGQQ